MEKYIVRGGKPLHGTVQISGAKNAASAIIPAVILSDEPCVLENVPQISDMSKLFRILTELGAVIEPLGDRSYRIDPRPVHASVVPAEIAGLLRASYYLLGVLLGRFHQARVAMPGGCNFGTRPIDQHLKGFRILGADCFANAEVIEVKANELLGGQVSLDVVSVGATINIMLAAVKAKGVTVIENAAREPHIVDLANFLNTMGADIMGAGTNTIKIRGVPSLHGAQYSVIPDQIEAGTYMAMAAATRGNVMIKGVIPKHLESIIHAMRAAGAVVDEFDDAVRVTTPNGLHATNVTTRPHPGFPTDMQPQIVAMLATANGTSIVTEGVWENRYQYIDQLRHTGVEISVDGRVAVIEGKGALQPAKVRATDLRAGAAMLIAALAANGESEIRNCIFVERGYENIVERLTALGADIEKVYTPG